VNSENIPSPGKESIINGLNQDLAREYKAIIQYVVFSSTLKGAEYGNIAEQLEKHASDELEHALKVAKQIDYLGGTPTMKGEEAKSSENPNEMMEIDLHAEQETIRNYGKESDRLRKQVNMLYQKY